MNILKKSFVLLAFTILTLVLFFMFSSFHGFSGKEKEPLQSSIADEISKDMEAKIIKMRQDIRRNGDKFEVSANPAIQYPVDQICTLNPEMKPGNSYFHENFDLPVAAKSIDTPASYFGYYSPVKDQGSCGCGWAFATTGEVEAVIKRSTGMTVDLSEQHLLDCNYSGYDCNGGWFDFDMFMTPHCGKSETCYPYQGYQDYCYTGCSCTYRINNWYFIKESWSVPPVESIKKAIYVYGSVAACVAVDPYFQAYKSGCYTRNISNRVNHAILLCGWSDHACFSIGSWYLKNSWGTAWGENGFMWIKYGVSSVGYAACLASYP
ncbi:MAG: C1 family peptidase [Candidatus Omnitrophota bacterium]